MWRVEKWFFYRHMIPVQSDAEYDSADLFPYAIQKVVAGCWRGKSNPDPVQGKFRYSRRTSQSQPGVVQVVSITETTSSGCYCRM